MNPRASTTEPHRECEGFEVSLSALVDGELEPFELPPALDHLAECPSCRRFYRRARRLDGAILAAEAAAGSEAPPPALWQRIAERGAPAPGSSRGRWLSRLAALLVLGFGLWALGKSPSGPGPETPPTEVDVVLASDGGRMDEERFVELATEVLRADHSFHHKMLEVMTAATRYASREGSAPDAWREASEDRLHADGEEPSHRDLKI